MNNIIRLTPPRGTIALPRRTPRPETAVDRIKAKCDPLTMARLAGVLVETEKRGGRRG